MEKIILRKKREFGDLISDSFNYLREHFKPLFRILLSVPVPVILLGAIFIGLFYSNFFQTMTMYDPDELTGNLIQFFIGFLFYGIGSVLLHATVVEYMKASLNKTKNEITFNEVVDGLKKNFGRYLLSAIIIFTLTFVGAMLCFIPGIWLSVVFSLYFFIIAIEGKDTGEAFNRSFSLIRNFWWRSFGLFILIGIIQTFLVYAVSLPISLLTGFITFSSENTTEMTQATQNMMAYTTPITMVISSLVYSLVSIAAGINYFSIVEEKEEVGLKERIESKDTDEESKTN